MLHSLSFADFLNVRDRANASIGHVIWLQVGAISLSVACVPACVLF